MKNIFNYMKLESSLRPKKMTFFNLSDIELVYYLIHISDV